MSNSLTLPRHALPADFKGGAAVRWPLAIAVALAVECAIVLLGWPAAHAPEPVVEPVKVMKLVSIAEAPPLPAPPQPTPPVPKTPPKPTPKPPPKPTSKPLPAPQAKADAIAPAVEPVAQSAPAPGNPAPPQPAAPATPPAPPKPQAGEIRRGLVPLQRVEPEYPAKALAGNIEGLVVAHVTIEKDGSVSAVKIVRSQPARVFDQAASKALMQWKFSRTDEPVLGEVELRFNLN